MRNKKLTKEDYSELADRIFVFQLNLKSNVAEHHAVKWNKEYMKILDDIRGKLWVLYQQVGAKIIEADTAEKK